MSEDVENSATGGVVRQGEILIGGELMGGCDLEAYTDPSDIIATFPGGAVVNAVLSLRKRAEFEKKLLEALNNRMDEQQSNPRDMQFKGFAKKLIEEMLAQRQGNWIDFNDWDHDEIEEYSQVIARRAYDLVEHTLSWTAHIDLDRLLPDEHATRIPDLTEWPEESA